ncbi:MAG: biosynthetic peptidoglycan transglycosylase [Sandaracinaceae bacterium]|nr:biosynthetic peptidoglycan transglycosylase [Sandaracinaceae bacterium]
MLVLRRKWWIVFSLAGAMYLGWGAVAHFESDLKKKWGCEELALSFYGIEKGYPAWGVRGRCVGLEFTLPELRFEWAGFSTRPRRLVLSKGYITAIEDVSKNTSRSGERKFDVKKKFESLFQTISIVELIDVQVQIQRENLQLLSKVNGSISPKKVKIRLSDAHAVLEDFVAANLSHVSIDVEVDEKEKQNLFVRLSDGRIRLELAKIGRQLNRKRQSTQVMAKHHLLQKIERGEVKNVQIELEKNHVITIRSLYIEQKDSAINACGAVAVANDEVGSDVCVMIDTNERKARFKFDRLDVLTLAALVDKESHLIKSGRANGEILINNSEDRWTIDFDVTLNNTCVISQLISNELLCWPELRTDGRLKWEGTELIILNPQVRFGDVNFGIRGAIKIGKEGLRAEGNTYISKVDCDKFLHSFPPEWLGGIYGMKLAGTIEMQGEVKIDSSKLDSMILELNWNDNCLFESVPAEYHPEQFRHAFHYLAYSPDGQRFRITTGPATSEWITLENISPFLVHAVLAHEDASFFEHRGFSLRSIRNAIKENIRAGRWVLGASTITMQLAKNLFLDREKTLIRKMREAVLTWFLEKHFTKQEILELYLNVIEYGPSLYGIKNAAAHYFGRAPHELTPAQAVFLATLLPNPIQVHEEVIQHGSVPSSFLRRMHRFANHLRRVGRFDEVALEEVRTELSQLAFARNGERVGLEVVRGRCAPLDGLGHSFTHWVDALQETENQVDAWVSDAMP